MNASYPVNAKTILALDFLAVLGTEFKGSSGYRRTAVFDIMNGVREDLIRRSTDWNATFRSCLSEAKQDVEQAQALLARLEDHGTSKDKERAGELVKDLETRKDTIEEGMKLLELIK